MGRDGGTDMPVNPPRVEMSAADLNAFAEKLAEANQARFGSLPSDDAPEPETPDWGADSANYRQAGGAHYLYMSVQPWEAMEAWMSAEAFRGYLRGNAIKYLARCDAKGGIEDIRKAQHYLARLLESYEQEGEG